MSDWLLWASCIDLLQMNLFADLFWSKFVKSRTMPFWERGSVVHALIHCSAPKAGNQEGPWNHVHVCGLKNSNHDEQFVKWEVLVAVVGASIVCDIVNFCCCMACLFFCFFLVGAADALELLIPMEWCWLRVPGHVLWMLQCIQRVDSTSTCLWSIVFLIWCIWHVLPTQGNGWDFGLPILTLNMGRRLAGPFQLLHSSFQSNVQRSMTCLHDVCRPHAHDFNKPQGFLSWPWVDAV